MGLLELPPEVLASVVMFLHWQDKLMFRRVCKRINAFITHCTGIWRYVSIPNYRKKIEQQVVEVLRIARYSVRHLSVTHEESLYSRRKTRVCPVGRLLDRIVHCRNLTKLDIANLTVTNTQLANLVSRLNGLSHLSVSLGWNLRNEHTGFSSYLDVLKRLQCVVLNGLSYTNIMFLHHEWKQIGFKPSSIIAVNSVTHSGNMQLYGELQELCTSIPDGASFSVYRNQSFPVPSISQTPMYVFGAHSYSVFTSTDLDTLCLMVASTLFDFASMSSRNIKSAVAIELAKLSVVPGKLEEDTTLLLPLHSLDISTQNLSAGCLDFIAQHCPNLQELNLEGSSKCCDPLLLSSKEAFFNDGMISISRSCPKLRALNISGICLENGIEICHTLCTMSCLECLCISHCVLVQPIVVLPHGSKSALAVDPDVKGTMSSLLGCLSKLKALQVKMCVEHREDNALNVLASQQLLSLISQCVSLKYLKVDLCHRSHVMGLDNLLQSCRLLQSLYLQVKWSIQIPDSLHLYTNLHHLYLSCPEHNMSMRLINALCNAKNVTHLYLYFRSVPGSGPFMLLQHLQKLVVFEMGSVLSPCRRHARFRNDILEYARSQGSAMLSSYNFTIGSLQPSIFELTTLSDLW